MIKKEEILLYLFPIRNIFIKISLIFVLRTFPSKLLILLPKNYVKTLITLKDNLQFK